MLSSHRNPSGNWKAIQHDVDEMSTYADTQEYFALTKQQQWLLLALCEYATWHTRWYSKSGQYIDFDDLDSRVSDMIYRLMRPVTDEINMFKLRQNQDNPCLLEQSQDDGATWSPAFDYSLCGQSNESYEQYIANQSSENQRRLELYDGTPDSIHQDCPTTTFDAGAGGVDALCGAIKAYVDRQVRDTQWRYRVAAGLIGAGVGLLATAGILGIIVGGVVAFIAGLALADIEAAANSRNDLDEVICALKDALDGTPVTLADFQSAIAALSGANSIQTTIVWVLQGNAGATVNYLMFLDMLGQAQELASSGLIECPCGGTWCYTFRFDTDGLGGWVSGGLGYTMNYSPGVGILHQDCVDTLSNPDVAYRGMYLQRTFETRTVTRVAIRYAVVKGTFDFPVQPSCYVFANGSVALISVAHNSETNGQHDRQWVGSMAMNDVRVYLRSSRDQSAPYQWSGSETTILVTLEGIGTNPFGEDNCE